VRSDVLFVSVILPILVMVAGVISYKVHDRWVDREIARERAEREGRQPG
jgi:hypothetical protein